AAGGAAARAAAGVELLVGDAAGQVHVRAQRVVVAEAGPPLVEVDVARTVEVLLAEIAEHVEIAADRGRAGHAPTVGVGAVGVGGHIAALDVVVGNAVGGGRRERGCDKQRQHKNGTVHRGPLSIVVVRPAADVGEGSKAVGGHDSAQP